MKKISFIIPCYNEEKSIQECLRRVCQLQLVGWEKEIIFVDDGSTDQSFFLAQEFRESSHSEVQIFQLPENKGKGAAIQLGLKQATGDVVLIQDADLEYDPADCQNLLQPFERGAQAVFGVRKRPFHHPLLWINPYFWGGTLVNLMANVFYLTWIKDLHCGYKIFERRLVEVDLLTEAGFSFCHELTATLLERKIKIEQIPISYYPRSLAEGKKIRAKDGLKALLYLGKRRLKSVL